ncbi:hypothetical protein [Xylophilus sp. ASV27]|uniref:hypothetical protein n=1 Tax=Xylophilus sp. ASV27 TaxID=2795129 RepID=UPI0018EBF121|nr:hypothetical protein [Xylophilus sp. ASV27]
MKKALIAVAIASTWAFGAQAMTASETRASDGSVAKVAEARKKAAEDKTDANYAAAKERCDALSGASKDACVNDVKANLGE